MVVYCHLKHESFANVPRCLFFCSAYCKSTHGTSFLFAGRLNVKIKVNGIRVNKTIGCLGNSVPCPTRSSQAFTFVQSRESNNIVLTEGHNGQQCRIFKLYLIRRGWCYTIHKASEGEKRLQMTSKETGRGRGFKKTPHLHYHNHQSATHPRPAPLNHGGICHIAGSNANDLRISNMFTPKRESLRGFL